MDSSVDFCIEALFRPNKDAQVVSMLPVVCVCVCARARVRVTVCACARVCARAHVCVPNVSCSNQADLVAFFSAALRFIQQLLLFITGWLEQAMRCVVMH